MKPVVQKNTEGSRLRIALAMAYAGLGLKAEALQYGKLARDQRSIAFDAVAGPPIAATLARVYTIVDEKELAVRALAPLLSTPFGLCVNQLKYDPCWDSLRSAPQSQLLTSNKP